MTDIQIAESYGDQDLTEFREIVNTRLESARKELLYLKALLEKKDGGADDEVERGQYQALIDRQAQFIGNLEEALIRIEDSTYGICRVTGKLIEKARLRAVPHATLSLEAKKILAGQPPAVKSSTKKNTNMAKKNASTEGEELKHDHKSGDTSNKYLMDQGVTNIPLNDIIPDPNQPRKFFNEQELEELAQSIIQVGIIEPILVRPVGESYMVVFGERRYRASVIANATQESIQTIPAMIKHLTDEEALELQIVENLQRHDPHPMEEAASFEKMLATLDPKEIATRIGRTAKFVAGRLRLNNLLPDFQEMFFCDVISMQDALALSRLSVDDQQSIYDDRVGDRDWRKSKGFQIHNLESIVKRSENNLDKATFNTEDAELYPEMPTCSNCKFNSKNNLSLFVEDHGQHVCSLSVCFNIKTTRAYSQTIEALTADPENIFVSGYIYEKSDKHKVKMVQDTGATVLTEGEWEDAAGYGRDEKPTYESIKDDFDVDYEFDDQEEEPTEEQIESKIQEKLKEELEEWDKTQKRIVDMRESGLCKRAFVIAGSGAGTFIDIILTKKGLKSAPTSVAPAAMSKAAEIAAIEQRETRAKELDAEKVWEEIRKLLVADERTVFKNSDELHPTENYALVMAMYDCLGYHSKQYFRDVVLKLEGSHYNNVSIAKSIEKRKGKHFDAVFNICARLLLADKLVTSGSSHEKSDTCYYGRELALHYMPQEVHSIELQQEEKAIKRGNNVKARIDALNIELNKNKANA